MSAALTEYTPWRAAPFSGIVGCGVVGKRGIVIATVPGPKDHAEPISRLIAASPQLLELAQHIVAMANDAYLAGHPEFVAIVIEARAAITAVQP